MRIFPTLAAAQAATGLKDNDLCYLAGSTVIGDAGAGWYGYVKASTSEAGENVIVVAVGGRLHRATEPISEYAEQIGEAVNAKLRAGGALSVGGSLTIDSAALAAAIDSALKESDLPVSGPLTDAQLRDSAVPVAGPLTDTQLRAGAVPVSAAGLPLPAGASTETTLAAIKIAAETLSAIVDNGRLQVDPGSGGGLSKQETADATGLAPASVAEGSVANLLGAAVESIEGATVETGTAGSPGADVVSAQGVPGGTPMRVDHSTTGIGHGVKTVTTAGTDVVLASSTAAKWVVIQAQTDNTGFVAVGASGIDASEATGTGVLLDAGESITLPCDNLADIYIDATVNGEGVRYTYGT